MRPHPINTIKPTIAILFIYRDQTFTFTFGAERDVKCEVWFGFLHFSLIIMSGVSL